MLWPANQWPNELLLDTADETAELIIQEAKSQVKLSFDEVRSKVLQEWLALAHPAGTA